MAQSDNKNFKHKTKRHTGFTLIELIVVMALIAIMAAIAVPNFLDWLPNMRLKIVIFDVTSPNPLAR